MSAMTPILAIAGLTFLVHTMSRLSREGDHRDDDRLEWYLAEARAYYDRADS